MDVDAVLGALADPIRRRIVERLGKGEATVGQLAEPFDVSMPAISRHLGVLERAGLITRTKQGQWRTCRLRVDTVDALRTWLGGLQPVWDRHFDGLEAHLASLQSAPSGAPRGPHQHDQNTHEEE
jgi:DNA-binding transcriptional ArsR family regulator